MFVLVHPWALRHPRKIRQGGANKGHCGGGARAGNGVPELSKQCFKMENVSNCVKCH